MEPTLKRESFEPTWALIKRPTDYPTYPTEGKIQMIFETNSKSLYHRLSPYNNYSQGVFSWGTQPFYFTYPDEAGKGLNSLRKYDSRLFPIGSAPIDIIRVTKFLSSGVGIKFLGKQFLLQTGNPYNETRIYNPTSPIVAAGMGLALGAMRPQRFIDTSGGLLGIASSLIGSSIPSLFKEPTINPPSGTTGLKALSDPMKSVGGKGLIRAGTAERAKSHLEAAWIKPTPKGFGQIALGVIKSLFSNFIPKNQNGIQVRSDEGAYGLMLGIGPKSRFSYVDANGKTYEFGQMWYGGGKNIRKDNQTPLSYKIFVTYDKNGTKNYEVVYTEEGFDIGISDIGQVGYRAETSKNSETPGMRYGDNVGSSISDRQGELYTHSDIMRQYANYANPSQQFPTKRSDPKLVKDKSREMSNLLDKIKKSGVYSVNVPSDSQVITSDKLPDSPIGYDKLFKAKEKGSVAKNFIKNYNDKGVRMVSNDLTTVDKSYKLPTAGHFDAINTLEVLDKNKKIKNMRLKSWTEWKPYEDDLIALYFYDIVNEKYIPFRAAIKGLSESGNASWEEMPFIGRGDKVYSYGGFNRNLSMTINIVISSLVELAPTWQRINYLTTLVKPANYTTSQFNGVMNRFMVPPMVMLTLGDLYKDQPVLIQSITTTIPDDAIWETQHQMNNDQWKYLVDYMNAPSDILFGQLPRTVDINLGLILLEKERAMVGGANFGHAPRRDDDEYKWNTNTVPDGGSFTNLHKSLVVNKDNIKIYSQEEYDAISAQYE